MSQSRILAIAFIIVGAILALVSALADFFQGTIGTEGTTFGWKQLLGLVLGIILIVAGIILLRQGDVEYEDDDEEIEEEVAEEQTERRV